MLCCCWNMGHSPMMISFMFRPKQSKGILAKKLMDGGHHGQKLKLATIWSDLNHKLISLHHFQQHNVKILICATYVIIHSRRNIWMVVVYIRNGSNNHILCCKIYLFFFFSFLGSTYIGSLKTIIRTTNRLSQIRSCFYRSPSLGQSGGKQLDGSRLHWGDVVVADLCSYMEDVGSWGGVASRVGIDNWWQRPWDWRSLR